MKLFNSKIKTILVSLHCEQEMPLPFFSVSRPLTGKLEEGPCHGWFGERNVPPSPAPVHFVSPDTLSFGATNRAILGLTTTHTCLNNHQGAEAEMHQRRPERCWRRSFSRDYSRQKPNGSTTHECARRDTVPLWGFSCRSYDHSIEGEWCLWGIHFVKEKIWHLPAYPNHKKLNS